MFQLSNPLEMERGSDAVVVCEKLQNEWTTETVVMGDRGFKRLRFKMSFGRISYITQHIVL